MIIVFRILVLIVFRLTRKTHNPAIGGNKNTKPKGENFM